MNKKIGRNAKCPCGSGLKFKKCHGKNINYFNNDLGAFHYLLKKNIEFEEKRKFQKERYGDIRPIISTDFKNNKVIAVGNEIFSITKKGTFQNFLIEYIQYCLGYDWVYSELSKKEQEMHQIIQWQKKLNNFTKSPCSGPIAAYLYLAYDLYILRHHSLLQKQLINRLKKGDQFQGARYETYVVATFIRAGFDIEFEDESDKKESHCEFVATHKESGKKYSIEAKSRHRPGILGQNGLPYNDNDVRLRVGKLLRAALKKTVTNKRIIFIDVNMPHEKNNPSEKKWVQNLKNELIKAEKEYLGSKAVPEAYLFFTNHPYHYARDDEMEFQRDFIMSAINMPDLKEDFLESTRKLDSPVLELWESIRHHLIIPVDFD
jgi:hypothetical protein